MTTAIKISNVSNHDETTEHIVVINENGNEIHRLAEGDTYTTHLYTGRQLSVEELLIARPAPEPSAE